MKLLCHYCIENMKKWDKIMFQASFYLDFDINEFCYFRYLA
jgi:hypothetical protein